jgi:purine-binding chemotaxis protein CheW
MRGGTLMNDARQYVTLAIADEVFAIPVERVREILAMQPVSHLPYGPDCLLGITDVRGRAVAVVDLRRKLGLVTQEAGEHTRILVAEVPVDGRELLLGLVADRVFEVTALEGAPEPPPELGTRWRAGSIAGIGRRHERFVIVLELGALFASDAAPLRDAALVAA